MNASQRKLLNIMQEGIPLVEKPFEQIGDQLGMSETEVLEGIESLREKGLLRRFGGIVNISELGVKSTLVGLRVEAPFIEAVAGAVSAYSGVTHNYERDDAYNLWFTLMEGSEETLNAHIEEIRNLPGVESLINLPAKNKYKTKVILKL
jgi:DNA-binding Lrp family transcriptional regulator